MINKFKNKIFRAYNFPKEVLFPAISKKTIEKMGSLIAGPLGKIFGNVIYSSVRFSGKLEYIFRGTCKISLRLIVQNFLGKNPISASINATCFNFIENHFQINSSTFSRAQTAALIAIVQSSATPVIDTVNLCLDNTFNDNPPVLFLSKCLTEGTIRGSINAFTPIIENAAIKFFDDELNHHRFNI